MAELPGPWASNTLSPVSGLRFLPWATAILREAACGGEKLLDLSELSPLPPVATRAVPVAG